tara:strand:+ start:216 stop:398 length:183 start_codon:yes stop_codon:yes gene_type:complete
MRYECKICKKNLTSQAIALLEGKIKEVKCTCSESEARELQKKIAKEFSLFTAYHDGEITI